MSFELKTENCLYMDCGGCVSDETTLEEKQSCKNGVICSRFVNDEYIHMSNLGENARRMLEIGVLQDELVKLGFSRFGLYEYTLLDKMYNQLVSVDFINLIITTSFYGGEQYYYSYASLTWQQDVLTKVKELMK